MTTPSRTRRTFTLFDAIVLVAAVAVALALIRWQWKVLMPDGGWYEWPDAGVSARNLLFLLWEVVPDDILPAFLAVGTPTALALRLRRPRPPMRRLVLQPGFAACLGALVSMFFCAFFTIAEVMWSGETLVQTYLSYMARWMVGPLCPIVAVWVLLALGRRCQPEPTWIDRAGRVLGVLWIVTSLLPELKEVFLSSGMGGGLR